MKSTEQLRYRQKMPLKGRFGTMRHGVIASAAEPARSRHARAGRWLPRTAVAAMGTSITLMIVLAVLGPGAGAVSPGLDTGPTYPRALPWPPWFAYVRPSQSLLFTLIWLTEVLGGAGVALGLLAVRRGWRPRPAAPRRGVRGRGDRTDVHSGREQ